MFNSQTQRHQLSALKLLGLQQSNTSQSSMVAAALAGTGNLSTAALLRSAQIPQIQSRPVRSAPIEQHSMSSDTILAALIGRQKLRQEAQLLSAQAPYVSQLDAAALFQATAQKGLSSLDAGSFSHSSVGNPLSDTAQHNAMVNEAFQRGKDEAILSLLRSGALKTSIFDNQTQPQHSVLSRIANAPPAFNQVPAVSRPAHQVSRSTANASENKNALETIGEKTIERRKKNAPYFDASSLADPDASTLANRRTRGGVTEPFPEKLHRLIHDAEMNGESDIISFFPHGRAFTIHHEERFCREIMPRYFKQSRFSSFQRQLNLYGFTRITNGSDARGYYHELFLKGRPALVIHMRRVGFPKPASSIPSTVKPCNPSVSPDFYSMTPIISGEKSEES